MACSLSLIFVRLSARLFPSGVPQWYTLYRGEDNSKVAGQLLVAISKWR